MVIWMDKYVIIYQKLKNTWSDNIFGAELENHINKLTITFKKMFITYSAVILSTAVVYICKPWINKVRTLITMWYLPCDIDEDNCFQIMITMQTIFFSLLTVTVLSHDVFFFGLIFHVYKEFEKIKYGLTNIPINEESVGDDKEVLDRISMTVKHHNFLLE